MTRRKRYSAEFKREAAKRDGDKAFPGQGNARDKEVQTDQPLSNDFLEFEFQPPE